MDDQPMTHSQCDLVVVSTDRFIEEARITAARLREVGLAQRFDCSLTLGEADPHLDGFRLLRRRAVGTWSSELRSCLEQLTKPYALLWLDDCVPIWIAGPDEIVALIDRAIAADADYLRLNPLPRARGPEAWPGVATILPGEHYRTSTVFCVWRRERLLQLLRDAESAWEFEYLGSARSDPFPRFFSAERSHVRHVNLVVKGLIDPRAESALRRLGVETTPLTKRRMTAGELWALRAREARARAFAAVPWRAQRWIHRFLTKSSAARG
jgi:hypothetical protein